MILRLREPGCASVVSFERSDCFEFWNNLCATGDCLSDHGAFPSLVPQLFKGCLVSFSANVQFRLNLGIAGRSFIVQPRPVPNVTERSLQGDLAIMNLDPSPSGLEHEAGHHACSCGGENVFVGACSRVCCAETLRLIKVCGMIAHVGLCLETSSPFDPRTPRPVDLARRIGLGFYLFNEVFEL